MDLRPNKLEIRGEDRLLIEWSDGQKREISFGELRKSCTGIFTLEFLRELGAEVPA